MDNVTIASMNCRGLSNIEKRRDVLQFFKSKKINLCCLQDTHFVDNDKEKIRKEWGGNCYFSCKTSNSRGVAILLGEGVIVDVKRIEEDQDGNFIILDLKLFEYDITLINLYGPNTDCPNFYTLLEKRIVEFDNPFVIMCGDWNVVQDFSLDTHNYIHMNNPKAKRRIQEMKNNLNVIDPWREIYANEKKYTWRQPTPLKMARLDYFLISQEFMPLVEKIDIIPGYRTDHSFIRLNLNLESVSRGRGYWKFNNSLLKDEQYTMKIKQLILETIQTYSKEEVDLRMDNFENYDFKNHEFVIDDQLLCDTLLMLIRGETISFSSMKKKQTIEAEKKLEEEILKLEKESLDTEEKQKILEELDSKHNRLEEFRKDKIKGILLRSALNWAEFGEKPSKFFLNLEKQKVINRYVNRRIYKLKDISENVIQDQKGIMTEIFKFFSNLYKKRSNKNVDWSKLIHSDVPKLDQHMKQSLEGPLTLDEITAAIQNMKNNKSPGLDGFTVEFFKVFWNYLKHVLLRSLNSAYFCNKMSYTQKLGIVSLLPKGSKDREYVKNWRPITLLNVFYKIGTSCIASRLKKILPFLINESQKSDRYNPLHG